MTFKLSILDHKILKETIDNCLSLGELGDFIVSILAGHINFDRLNIGVLDLENYSFKLSCKNISSLCSTGLANAFKKTSPLTGI